MLRSISALLNQLLNCIKKIVGFPYCITITIVGFFVFVFFIIVFSNSIGFGHVAEILAEDFQNADTLRTKLVLQYSSTNNCTQALVNQYQYLGEVKKQHLFVTKKFEVYYYGFVLVAIIATVVASIIGVLIARTGWQNQRPAVKAMFIGFFFSASLAVACMNVFNNSENSNKNISKYFYYTNLQTNIYNAIGSGDTTKLNNACTDSTLLKVFWENNKNLKENMNLFLDIKADKIPSSPDINKVTGMR
jgi:hypothetical protein